MDEASDAHRAAARRDGGYFAHIDGLRCLAIVSVVAYHARFTVVSGGFVGVDVFFVISGFLIISGLDREVRGDGIRFGAFYFRRLRRLMPALVPMLTFVLATGAALYTPIELKTLAASVVATIFFAANLFFYSKASYFEQSSETRPLLHAWSLGIEEQFYIIVPAAIWVLWRVLGRHYVYAIAALMLGSFALALVTMHHSQSAAFYLMPQRAWELLAGGVVGIIGPRYSAPRIVREIVAAGGLGALVIAFFAYSATMSFPGVAALLPVAGAAAGIWADLSGRTTAGRLLALPPLAWVGGLSYALYLWHWPILVYGRFLAVDDMSVAARLGVVSLAAAAAWLSTRLIEDRAQRHFHASRPWRLVVPAVAALGVGVIVAGGLFASGGWPTRRPAAVWRAADRETWANPDRETCFTGTTQARTARTLDDIRAGRLCRMGASRPSLQYLLWGDSHAEAIRPAFDIAGRRLGLAGAFVGEGGCPPIPGVTDLTRGADYHCRATNDAVLDLIAREHIGLVILHSRWVGEFSGEFVVPGPDGRPIHGDDSAAMAAALVRTVQALAARGTTAVVMGAMPEPGFDVPVAIIGPACCARAPRKFHVDDAWRRRASALNDDLLAPAMRAAHIPFADPLPVFCQVDGCPANRGTLPLFYDYRHVSPAGAALFADAATALMKAGEEEHVRIATHR